MKVVPGRLNLLIAALFMAGSLGFALGSMSSYASAVGVSADALTFFVSSLLFTAASFLQLAQSQSPGMQPAGLGPPSVRRRLRLAAWLPHDKSWLAAATQFPGTLFFNGTTFWALSTGAASAKYDQVVWRPDFYGSILFLVSSTLAILAVGRFLCWRPADAGWRVAWLNMIGSVAFMASAVGAFVLPRTQTEIDLTLADRGTLVGAVCFFAGALLMIPAWRREAAAQEQTP